MVDYFQLFMKPPTAVFVWNGSVNTPVSQTNEEAEALFTGIYRMVFALKDNFFVA